MNRRPTRSTPTTTPFPYPPLFRSADDLAAAPMDGQPIRKALVLDVIERGEHPGHGRLMGFARRHAADAPAFLLRGIALQYAKARQFGTDSERPCVGLE